MEETIIIRITDNGQFDELEFSSFVRRHPNITLVKEFKSYNPDLGPHYHGFFRGNLTKKTIIHYLKTELNCKGNEDYSTGQKELKECKSLDGYIRYICKGEKLGEPPTVFYNIESTEVLRNHEEFYSKQDEYKKQVKDKSSKNLHDLVEHVRKELNEIYENQYYQIPLIILEYHKKNYKIISDFQCENYYHYIRGQLDEEYVKRRAERIYEKLNR